MANSGPGTDPKAIDDRELVRRAKSGDISAFETLFLRYRKRIYNLVYRMTGDAEDAADVTQETFVRTWRALPRIQEDSYFLAWLWRVATNLCRDYARRRKRKPTSSLDIPIQDESGESVQREVEDSTFDPASVAIRRERVQRVQEAILKLRPERREVVLLHHLQGADVKQIADALQIPVGTVKSRLARGREDLKKLLKDYMG